MADVNANIGVNIDTSAALAQLKSLQRQISQFNTSIAKSSEQSALAQKSLNTNLINSINSIGAFSAELRTIRTTSEQFTASLESNKFSMREYFRYAGGATKTFGKLFRSEFDTISNVAEERVKKLQTQYIKLGRDSNGAMKAIAVIPKELNMSDYNTQVQIAAQRQALFNQLMKQGSTNLINFGKNTQWAGRQLMVGFTIPLSILGSTATRVFMDMETQAIKFKKVYGDLFTSREESQQALDDIKALGSMYTQYGIAVSQTVGLAAEAAAAGFSGIDLQRQTTQATRLSVLGQVDSQKALETTISLQNAFRTSSAELANQIDFLNAVENQTVVSLDDITTAIPKVAPVIQQLGGDVKDLAFFMAAMKEGGVNASEGANALKSGLAALINPTTRASQMLAGMGINIKGIIETNKGNLRNTVVEFAKALDTLDPLTRARAIEQLFGKFQFARLSTLFDNVTRQGTQAARVLDLASTSVEGLAALSEQELELTAASSMNKFKKAIEDVKAALVPVGQTFLDAITPIINFVGGILERFNDLSAGTKRVITILTVGLGAVGPVLLMTFGLLANGVGNLIKLFLTLRNGYLRLTGQSQILGEQTQYLTTEQLQAEAVAHSLDQSHAKLTQTFTAETGQLNQLAAAYQRAMGAMQRFAASNPGSMIPPRRMASGGMVVGPGTGTSDSIPAMLSNGETVVPAKQSKKYGGLINGIIADNIPGFKRGLVAERTGTSVNVAGAWQAAHFGGSNEATGAQLIEMSKGATQAVQNAILDMVSSFENGMERRFTVFSNEVVAMSRTANEGVGTPGSGKSIPISLAKEDLIGKGAKVRDVELQRQLQKSGMSIEEIATVNEQITESISEGFNKLGDKATITGDEIDNLINDAYAKVEQTYQQVKDSRIKDARQQMKQITAVTDPRTDSRIQVSNDPYTKARKTGKYYRGMQQISGAESVPYTEVGRFKISNNMASQLGMTSKDAANVFNQFSDEIQIKLSKLKGNVAQFTKEFAIEAKKSGLVIGNATIDGIAEATQSKSPSKKAIIQGKNVADGMKIGLLDNKGQVLAASKEVGNAAVGGLLGPTGQPISRDRRLADINAGRNIPQTTIINTKTVENMKAFDTKLARMNNTIMGGTFALTALASAGSMAGGTLGNISGQIGKYSGLLFGLMAITQLLTQAKIAELAATRLSVASNAMKAARGGFGIAGRGLAANSGIIGTIARLGVGLKAFMGPIGLVATALTVGVSLYRLNNKRLEENRKKLEAFGNAVATSKDQVKSTGEYFGIIPTRTGLENATPEKLVSNADRAAINQFKESDTFKEYSGTVDAVSRLSSADATLALQTKGAELLGKGFTQEQVNIIITSIQEAAGKSDLNINFKTIKLEDLQKDIETGLGAKLAALPKFINDTMKKEMYMNDSGQWVSRMIIGPEAKAEIDNQGQAIKAYLNGLSGMVSSGQISFEKFNESFDKFGKLIKTTMPDSSQQTLVLDAALKQMGGRVATAAMNVEGFEGKLLLAKAAAMGLNLEISGAMINSLIMADAAGATADDYIRAAAVTSDINKLMEKQNKIREILNKKTGTETGGSGEKSWLEKLNDQKKATLQQAEAFYKMRDAGIDAATASELASNPEFAKGISTAAEKGGAAWNAATKAIKAYKKAQDDLRMAEIAGMDQGDYELQRLNKAQAYIDLQTHFIQMQYSAQLDIIDKSQQENDLLLQRIAYQETLINNRYNPIIEQLTKIQDLNKSIADIEARRVDVVTALSSGDIAGGVRALTDLRSARGAQTGQSQIDSLNAARERELALVKQNNLTKEQLDLQNQKLALDKKEIESTIAKQTANLTYFNMTRSQIDNAAKALDLAKSAGLDINDPGFLNNVLDAAIGKTGALEAAMKSAAGAMSSLFALQESARTQNIPSAAPTVTAAPQLFTTTSASGTKITTPWDTGAGKVIKRSMGGMIPKYFAGGGFSRGTDTIPAMLTAGEYVIRKSAVDSLGVGTMNSINNGNMPSTPVYNYSLSVNVGGSNNSADDIARAVMSEIKRIDSQRVRGVR
jgi:TP901 family phage tail tape measure protein